MNESLSERVRHGLNPVQRTQILARGRQVMLNRL